MVLDPVALSFYCHGKIVVKIPLNVQLMPKTDVLFLPVVFAATV